MISTAPDSTTHRLSDDACDTVFTRARTYTAWLDRPVEDDLLHQLYELMKGRDGEGLE